MGLLAMGTCPPGFGTWDRKSVEDSIRFFVFDSKHSDERKNRHLNTDRTSDNEQEVQILCRHRHCGRRSGANDTQLWDESKGEDTVEDERGDLQVRLQSLELSLVAEPSIPAATKFLL